MAGLNLARLYMGAGYSPSAARQAGISSALVGSAGAQDRRRRLLEQALRSGKVKPKQLGAMDASLLGLRVNAPKDVGTGPLGKIGGLFANLGEDIFNAGKYFVPSLYDTGRAALSDIFHLQTPGLSVGDEGGLTTGGKSQLREKVAKPMLKSYAEMYGPAIHGDVGETLRRMYQHPLQPILDAATVASLGLGTAAKASALPGIRGTATGERLASLTSPEGRAGLRISDNNELARDYSRAPLRRLSQKGYDTAAERIGPLGNLQRKRAVQLDLRRSGAARQAAKAQATQFAIRRIAPALQRLSEPENIALGLAQRGVNTPERLAVWQDSVRKTLRNEHDGEDAAKNIENYVDLGVDPAYVQRRLEITEDPRFQEVLFNPTPQMIDVDRLWKADVKKGQEQIGFDPVVHETHLANRRELLGGEDPENYPIEPDYAPDMLASGFKVEAPGPFHRVIRGGNERVVRERPKPFTKEITGENLLVGRRRPYMHDSTGATFMAGVFRTDGRALLDHISRRERDVIDEAFNTDLVNRYALKDSEGNRLEFKPGEYGKIPDGWVPVSEQFPIQWFRAEMNMLEGTIQRVEALKKQGFDEFSPEGEQFLTDLQDAHAEAFMKSHFGAMRRPAVAVPREFFDYQKQILQVNDPYRIAGFNWAAKWMHRWRTATLAYMPRWAMNTAVGSFLLALIKGVVRPGDYITANRLARTFRDEHGNIIREPGRIGRRLGREDQVLRTSGNPDAPEGLGNIREPLLPPGVDLRSAALQDYLEPGMVGRMDYDNIGEAVGPKFKYSRWVVNNVQSIEDFFRRAHFIQNLRGEAKQLMLDRGESLKSFYQELDNKPRVEQWLDDPRLVNRAIDQTNKWSYAYGELGPWERRVLRQFIPFWGWYKFITKFVWRMGVDNPARAQMVNQLSSIGKDAEDELGLVPPWVRGSILLNLHGGRLQYLSTAGINPLAQFANPIGPEGAKSLVTLGQGSPLMQAALSAMGIDTLRGGAVPISPMEGVAPGLFGQPVNTETGQTVDPATRSAYRRGLMGLIRSVPQFRMGEQLLEGGSVYPESVPIFADRPMPRNPDTPSESWRDTVLLPTVGFNTNTLDLKGYQELAKANQKYSLARQRNLLKKIKANR